MLYLEEFSKPFNFRYNLNLVAAFFIIIGTFCDFGTFYYSKNVQIFDEEPNKNDKKELQKLNENDLENLKEQKAAV